MEAIVLAGGLGTRLQGVISDIPKPMALINERPFLEYLLNYLNKNKIQKVILSVGYKHEVIFDYFHNEYKNLELIYSVEDEPLGTGGGIMKATGFIENEIYFVINGDTLFDVDLKHLYHYHIDNDTDLTLALKYMSKNSRYGSVSVDKDKNVTGFVEKNEIASESYINGGIYLINKNAFNKADFPEKFSFEKDFLEKYYKTLKFKGLSYNNYFLDIGIPEDYKLAQTQFKELEY